MGDDLAGARQVEPGLQLLAAGGAQDQCCIELATAQAAGDDLPGLGLQRPESLGQLELRFEVAMVDGADLPQQRTQWRVDFATGENRSCC
jgi:hypothetical protein